MTIITVELPDGTVATWTLDLDESEQDTLTDWLEARLGRADLKA